MALQKQEYLSVRNEMQVGDIIAFAGDDFISGTIKLFTFSAVSHVAVVSRRTFYNDEYRIEIIESGYHKGQNGDFIGVKTELLSTRIDEYGASGGQVWWLPLSVNNRQRLSIDNNESKFLQFLYEQNGKPYDLNDAIKAGIDILDKAGITKAKENFNKLFCSELAAASLKQVAILPKTLNSSEVTPIDLCMFNLYENNYVQLVGKQKEIKGYNSISNSLLNNWGA